MKILEKPVKVSLVDTLTSNSWFSIVLESVMFPDGSKENHYTVRYPAPAVGIVARKDKEYLLLYQYRFRIGEYVWAIPSGGVNPGESLEDAAARELLEETGYKASKLEHLIHYNPSYGSSNQRFEIFIADEPVETEQPFNSKEVIEIKWFPKEQVFNMIFDNKIVDGFSLVGLLLDFLK